LAVVELGARGRRLALRRAADRPRRVSLGDAGGRRRGGLGVGGRRLSGLGG
jgi:hypothetical protein